MCGSVLAPSVDRRMMSDAVRDDVVVGSGIWNFPVVIDR